MKRRLLRSDDLGLRLLRETGEAGNFPSGAALWDRSLGGGLRERLNGVHVSFFSGLHVALGEGGDGVANGGLGRRRVRLVLESALLFDAGAFRGLASICHGRAF